MKYVLNMRVDSAVCMPNMNTLALKLSKIIFDDTDNILYEYSKTACTII